MKDAGVIVRHAEPRDSRSIADIWNHYIRHTAATFTTAEKTPQSLVQDIAQREAEGKAFLVAENLGQIIGFATYFQFRGGPGYAHTAEHSVMLNAEAQGKGAGRALMLAMEEHARQAGMHSLMACVSAENPAGIAFHQSLGYRRIATLPEVGRKFGRWMDLVLLQKLL